MNYGGIEAGGTKFICAVSDESLEIIAKKSIETTNPKDTLKKVFDFFEPYKLAALGIGSFGPIEINKNSELYGSLSSTPKKGWENFKLLPAIKKEIDVPIQLTTDVNAAAYGEWKHGSAKGLESCIYLTIGTGIGAGAIVNGEILSGFGHPEMGHIGIKKHKKDKFNGNCPYHSDCFEGMASGPAIEKRYGEKGYELADKKEVWQIEADYIAQALINYSLILRPERIILGGGVMKQKQLFPLIKNRFRELMNDYLSVPDLDTYIVPPILEDNAGIVGCLQLAMEYK